MCQYISLHVTLLIFYRLFRTYIIFSFGILWGQLVHVFMIVFQVFGIQYLMFKRSKKEIVVLYFKFISEWFKNSQLSFKRSFIFEMPLFSISSTSFIRWLLPDVIHLLNQIITF